MSVWKRMPELDPAIQKRIRLEWRIIRRVVMAAIADGCSYSLDYLCDDEEFAVADSVKISELREAIHACDEERIYFKKNGESAGWIYLVYGNDGWDVIADNSLKAEKYVKAADSIIEKYS